MDTASIAASLVAGRTNQVQVALAGKMMKMNAEAAQSVVKLIDDAQANIARLTRTAPGVGTKVDISV